MSHIAAALAKSKGKTVTPPPESSVAPSTPGLGVSTPPIDVPAAAPATAKSSRALVLAVGLLLVCGGGGAWWYFSQAHDATIPAPPAKAVAAPKPELSANVAANQRTEQAVMKALNSQPSAPAPAPAAPVAAEPTGDFFELVRKMSVSAVVEGPRGRAMIDGKMTQIGQEVAPGLTLQEIRGGRLIFRDAAGNDYPRRF